MKELTIEQKAKAYDEALERAKDFINGEVHYELRKGENIMCWIFPELRESEDDRIRKELIDFVKSILTGFPDCKRFTDWLEKQCEQKPKFKMGDWVIVHNKDAYQVIEVNEHNYRLKHFLGGEMPFPFTQESSLRKWTIQDVKDGDVLAAEPIDNYQFPFIAICKNCGFDFFNSYCFIGFDGKFYEADEGHAVDNIHPATKEQRSILFQKMKEAGYEWDAEKKELKKIEQKPIEWSEEDEEHIKSIISTIEMCKTGLHSPVVIAAYNEDLKWLKSLRPQNSWIIVDKEVYVKEPVLAQKKDKSDQFQGYVFCCDHTLMPNVYERYMILSNIVSWNRWKPSDEQMLALDIALENFYHPDDRAALESLRNDLQKLL